MARGIPITRGGVSCSRGIKRLAANVTGSHEMVRRAERVTQPPENSLLLANVSSPFSFGPVCRSSASCPWSSSGGMQMDDFVRESRVSRSCTRPSENNKSRLTTPVRSLRFVSFIFFLLFSPFFLFSSLSSFVRIPESTAANDSACESHLRLDRVFLSVNSPSFLCCFLFCRS